MTATDGNNPRLSTRLVVQVTVEKYAFLADIVKKRGLEGTKAGVFYQPTFNETGNKGPHGYFDPKKYRITLTNNADLSTFLHESGHFYLEVMRDIVPMDGSLQTETKRSKSRRNSDFRNGA